MVSFLCQQHQVSTTFLQGHNLSSLIIRGISLKTFISQWQLGILEWTLVFGIRCPGICFEILNKFVKHMGPLWFLFPESVDGNNCVYFVSIKLDNMQKYLSREISPSMLISSYSSEKIAFEIHTIFFFNLLSLNELRFSDHMLTLEWRVYLNVHMEICFKWRSHMVGIVKTSFLPSWKQVLLFWYFKIVT